MHENNETEVFIPFSSQGQPWRDLDALPITTSTSRDSRSPIGTGVRSRGISSKSFHKSEKKKTPVKVQKILDEAENQEIVEELQKCILEHKIRIAALKDVTSYKIWPLQEPAFQDLDRMMVTYLGSLNMIETHDGKNTKDAVDASDLCCSTMNSKENLVFQHELESDSTGLSNLSIEHPKRRKEDMSEMLNLRTSPGKRALREKFREDFLQERAIPPRGTSSSNRPNKKGNCEEMSFLSPLWSMEPRIFAVEKSGTGRRKYVVANLGRFMDHYWRKCDPSCRHYYELIRENTPCRLYFGK